MPALKPKAVRSAAARAKTGDLSARIELFFETLANVLSGKQSLTATHLIGLLGIAENPDLNKGVKDAVTATVPFVFIGVTPQGQHVRVFYFKGAKILPD